MQLLHQGLVQSKINNTISNKAETRKSGDINDKIKLGGSGSNVYFS
jgi:hypothetical protein